MSKKTKTKSLQTNSSKVIKSCNKFIQYFPNFICGLFSSIIFGFWSIMLKPYALNVDIRQCFSYCLKYPPSLKYFSRDQLQCFFNSQEHLMCFRSHIPFWKLEKTTLKSCKIAENCRFLAIFRMVSSLGGPPRGGRIFYGPSKIFQKSQFR